MRLIALALLSAACSGASSKTFTLTVSGEEGATGATTTTDGWTLRYEHVLVTVANPSLSENPDRSLTDQSQTGPRVETLGGAFAVDLALAGPLDAKAMNGKAWKLGEIKSSKIDPTLRYAFGYELVAATSDATKVNLDAAGEALYAQMVAKGWSVLYQGTATHAGNAGCRSTGTYDWDNRLPRTVRFTFGWSVPAEYVNCLNPDLTPSGTRGVQAQTSGDTLAQVTLHLDHPYWESLEEDAPLRFDAIAARATGMTVTEAALQGVDFQALKDAQGNVLPIRFCGPQQSGEPTTGSLRYDPRGVPVNPAGGAAGLKDLYEYTAYNLATFGHLNNDGLCYPRRNYPSP